MYSNKTQTVKMLNQKENVKEMKREVLRDAPAAETAKGFNRSFSSAAFTDIKRVEKSFWDYKKLFFMLIAVIVLVFLIKVFMVSSPGSGIIGLTIFEKDSSRDKQSLSLSQKNSDSSPTENSDADNLILQKTKHIDGKVSFKEYSITLKDTDISLDTKSVSLLTKSMSMKLNLDKPIQLKRFNGELNWQNGQLILNGDLSNYLTDLVEIDWTDKENVSLKINEGSLKIDNLLIPSLQNYVSGRISIDDKMTINLEDEFIAIKNYKGSFVSEMGEEGASNTLILNGTSESLEAKTRLFGAVVS